MSAVVDGRSRKADIGCVSPLLLPHKGLWILPRDEHYRRQLHGQRLISSMVTTHQNDWSHEASVTIWSSKEECITSQGLHLVDNSISAVKPVKKDREVYFRDAEHCWTSSSSSFLLTDLKCVDLVVLSVLQTGQMSFNDILIYRHMHIHIFSLHFLDFGSLGRLLKWYTSN